MSKYSVTTGVQTAPVKTVLYGPEGIGKSTFASHFPDPVFIDTEGGTKRLNVVRLPQPTSWAMLLDEVAEVRKGNVPCSTLVIDTADWAERLCIQAVCARAKVNGIEDFGYGKGYTYVKEEFSKLLDALEEVLNAGLRYYGFGIYYSYGTGITTQSPELLLRGLSLSPAPPATPTPRCGSHPKNPTQHNGNTRGGSAGSRLSRIRNPARRYLRTFTMILRTLPSPIIGAWPSSVKKLVNCPGRSV